MFPLIKLASLNIHLQNIDGIFIRRR